MGIFRLWFKCRFRGLLVVSPDCIPTEKKSQVAKSGEHALQFKIVSKTNEDTEESVGKKVHANPCCLRYCPVLQKSNILEVQPQQIMYSNYELKKNKIEIIR